MMLTALGDDTECVRYPHRLESKFHMSFSLSVPIQKQICWAAERGPNEFLFKLLWEIVFTLEFRLPLSRL